MNKFPWKKNLLIRKDLSLFIRVTVVLWIGWYVLIAPDYKGTAWMPDVHKFRALHAREPYENIFSYGLRVCTTVVSFSAKSARAGVLFEAWKHYDNIVLDSPSYESRAELRPLSGKGPAASSASPDFVGLPDVKGFHRIPSLYQAMGKDPALESRVMWFAATPPDDLWLNPVATDDLVREIIFLWTDTDQVPEDSRGWFIDGRVLAVLEEVVGEPFFQQHKWYNPRPYSALMLKETWEGLFVRIHAMLMAQTSAGRNIYGPDGGLSRAYILNLAAGAHSLRRGEKKLFWNRMMQFIAFTSNDLVNLTEMDWETLRTAQDIVFG